MVSRQPEGERQPLGTPLAIQAQYRQSDRSFYSSSPQVIGLGEESECFSSFNSSYLSYLIHKNLAVSNDEVPVYSFPDAHPAVETSQPTANYKRKDIPMTMTADTTVVTKHIKVEGSGSHSHIRTADFNELTQSIIEETISIYCAQIGGVEPFPERADDRNAVKQAWLEVCTSRSLKVELKEDIFKLVCEYLSK
jgi:hypothetical protein